MQAHYKSLSSRPPVRIANTPTVRLRDEINRQNPHRVRLIVPRNRHTPTSSTTVPNQIPQPFLDDVSRYPHGRHPALHEHTHTALAVGIRNTGYLFAGFPESEVADGGAGANWSCVTVDDGLPEARNAVEALAADQAASTIDPESTDAADKDEICEDGEDGCPHVGGISWKGSFAGRYVFMYALVSPNMGP